MKMASPDPKPIVFVSMPSGKASNERYNHVVKPACNSVGAICERADDLAYRGSISQEVYSHIAGSDVMIADISQLNPNVLYELGVAHGLGKPTLILADESQDIPFDLASSQVVFSGGAEVRFGEEVARVLRMLMTPWEARRGRIAARPIGVEQVLAIVYGDIVSSTKMVMKLGELDASEVIRHRLVRVGLIARKHEGRLVKLLGDGFLAIFDTAQSAMAFTLHFREVLGRGLTRVEPPIQIRLAVHMGPVVTQPTQYGEDVIGAAVLVAVRLAETARPGQIIVSSSAAGFLPKKYLKRPMRRKQVELKHGEKLSVFILDTDKETSTNGKRKQATGI
jgi:class 3 adenylate cyclase